MAKNLSKPAPAGVSAEHAAQKKTDAKLWIEETKEK
jgi:hypothetical protein